MTVFRFNIFYKNSDGTLSEAQQRFVMAESEEEAERKLNVYRKTCVEAGGADFDYSGAWVELDNVIF